MSDKSDTMNFPALPPKWDGWTIQKKIGEGSFGIVYEAVREEEHCAVKIIDLPKDEAEMAQLLIESKDRITASLYLDDMVGSYVSEIETMVSLRDDPHIVRIEDHEIRKAADGIGYRIFIRMELLSPLQEIYDEAFTQEQAVKLGLDICDALCACDSHKIIHRDIKPANIFVSKEGTFKLGDFGAARQLDLSFGTYSTKGTFSYMAPEIYRQDRYNKQVDIYSLGIVLYRLMNRNRDPFVDPVKQLVTYTERQEALTRRMQGEALPPPYDASEKLAAVILKACAFDRAMRYRDAAAMKADLLKVMDPNAVIDPLEGLADPASAGVVGSGVAGSVGTVGLGISGTAAAGVAGSTGTAAAGKTGAGITGTSTAGEDSTNAAGAAAAAERKKQSKVKNRSKKWILAVSLIIILAAALIIGRELLLKRGSVKAGKKVEQEGRVALREEKKEDGFAWSEEMQAALEGADALVTELATYRLTDAEEFQKHFTHADNQSVEEYFVDLRGFNSYPARTLVPMAQIGDVFLINLIGYEQEEASQEDESWSKGWTLFLRQEDGVWKIDLDPDVIDEFGQMLYEGGFPEGYIPYMTGDHGIMVDKTNYMYLDPESVYDDALACQVRFIWQDENGEGDLFITAQFTNGTNTTTTFRELAIQLNDKKLANVLDCPLEGEVTTVPGTNELVTWKINTDLITADMSAWTDITPVLQFNTH